MRVKKDDECDSNDFNFLDKELVYLAQIMGSRQKYIKIVLTRGRVNESVYSESYGEEGSSQLSQSFSLSDKSVSESELSYIIKKDNLKITCKVYVQD